MNIKLSALVAALLVSSVNANAEIQTITGTADVYDSAGESIVGIPTPVTGEYDTDTQQITVDPWFFLGTPVTSQIQVLSPGTYSFPGISPINVGSGQLGGMVTSEWHANAIPHAIVWDVTLQVDGQHFEPVDSDGDGIPGHRMISGIFPGLTIVYEFGAGEPGPGIDIQVNVTEGTNQQCDEVGGNSVELTTTVGLSGGAELASIDWTIDGNAAGSGVSITPFLSLGTHSISVTATTVSGVYDTATTNVQVIDTVKPNLSIEFIDTRTGEAVSSVEGAGVTFIEARLSGYDACDADVYFSGVAKPVTAFMGGMVIKIQGNNNDVDMPTNAIDVTATAIDDSGNKQLDQAVLPINN